MTTIQKIKDLMEEMGKETIDFDTPIIVKLSPHRELVKIKQVYKSINFLGYKDGNSFYHKITEDLIYHDYIVNSIYQRLAIMNLEKIAK